MALLSKNDVFTGRMVGISLGGELKFEAFCWVGVVFGVFDYANWDGWRQLLVG